MKPQLSSIMISSISTMVGCIGFFIQEIPILIRIIIFLSTVIISLVIYILLYWRYVKKQVSHLENISANHKALSLQFENKNKLLSIYRENWRNMQYHISLLNQKSISERAKSTQDYYIMANAQIIEKENEYND